MIDEALPDLVDAMHRAWETRIPVVDEKVPGLAELSLSGARTVRDAFAAVCRQAGSRPVGYKVGLSTPLSRRQFGAGGPEFGRVFEERVWRDGQAIPLPTFLVPRLEPELAFIANAPIHPGMSRGDLLRSMRVSAAFEIVDSRFGHWDITLSQLVADNGVGAAAVLATDSVPAEGLDLRNGVALFDVDGVSYPLSSSAVDDPAETVQWLLGRLAVLGDGLRPGEFVLTGSWSTPIPLTQPLHASVTFERVGSLKCSFE